MYIHYNIALSYVNKNKNMELNNRIENVIEYDEKQSVTAETLKEWCDMKIIVNVAKLCPFKTLSKVEFFVADIYENMDNWYSKHKNKKDEVKMQPFYDKILYITPTEYLCLKITIRHTKNF